jgi:hypothetical protein
MPHKLSSLVPSPTMAVAFAALLAASGGLAVAATSSSPVIRACANKKTGALRLASKCRRNERPVSWNQTGLTGAIGAAGATGAPGKEGPQGKEGPPGPTKLSAVKEVLGPEVFVAAGKFGESIATCPKGTRAISGGQFVESETASPTTDNSRATKGRAGWVVEVGNGTGTESIFVEAIAFCAGEGEAVAG